MPHTTPTKEHLIFGAGLVGTYLGIALSQSNCSVSFVARPSTKEKLSQGIRAEDLWGHSYQLPNPQLLESSSLSNPPNYLWLTVKCTSLKSAVDDMKPFVGPNTLIICLQNGLGAETIVQKAFPEHQVIRGVMAPNVTEPSPGCFFRATDGGIDLADTEITRKLKNALASPLLPLELHENLDAVIWAKLQLNLNNAINALANIPLLDELQQRSYRRVLAKSMEELIEVAEKKGIELAKLTQVPAKWMPKIMRLPDWLFKLLAKKMLAIDPQARSSMWQDLSTGRPTEIEFINGALVSEGSKLGVHCEVNKKIIDLVRLVETGQRPLGASDYELRSLGL